MNEKLDGGKIIVRKSFSINKKDTELLIKNTGEFADCNEIYLTNEENLVV